jgi:hypothetical protein
MRTPLSILLVVMAGCSPPARDQAREVSPPGKKKAIERTDTKREEERLAGQIARSAWWKGKVTDQDVVRIADVVASLGADDGVEITPDGQYHEVRSKGKDPRTILHLQAMARAGVLGPKRGVITVFIDGSRPVEKMTRLEALRRLQEQISAVPP